MHLTIECKQTRNSRKGAEQVLGIQRDSSRSYSYEVHRQVYNTDNIIHLSFFGCLHFTLRYIVKFFPFALAYPASQVRGCSMHDAGLILWWIGTASCFFGCGKLILCRAENHESAISQSDEVCYLCRASTCCRPAFLAGSRAPRLTSFTPSRRFRCCALTWIILLTPPPAARQSG